MTKKKMDQLVDAGWRTYMSGVAIPMLDIPTIMAEIRLRLGRGQNIHEVMLEIKNRYQNQGIPPGVITKERQNETDILHSSSSVP